MTYSDTNPPPTTNSAHVYSDTILTDTVNWIKHTGIFIADSSYTNIMLGSFFDKANTDTVMINAQNSYNYTLIDDVCVSANSAYCADFVGVKQHQPRQKFSIYSNPTSGEARISVGNGQLTIGKIEVLDLLGKPVAFHFDIGRSVLDIRHSPPGIYFVRVGDSVAKLVKQ